MVLGRDPRLREFDRLLVGTQRGERAWHQAIRKVLETAFGIAMQERQVLLDAYVLPPAPHRTAQMQSNRSSSVCGSASWGAKR